jgi:hypothetical protein
MRMAKEPVSWEKIEKFLLEGYRIRVKIVKGKKYLAARIKGDDKGLGPFTQEMWDKIQSWQKVKNGSEKANAIGSNESAPYTISLKSATIVPQSINAEFSRREIENALFEIKIERARIKTFNCKHSKLEYCSYWNFVGETENIDTIYSRFGKEIYKLPVSSKETSHMFHVNELLCMECDKYTPREKKIEILHNKNNLHLKNNQKNSRNSLMNS